jgi:RNA polymerase sigma factor (sigma-70 family)
MDEIKENWVERLTAEEAVRDAAIEELRALILRGLSHSMSRCYGGIVQAEDVAQEALLKILGSLDKFEGRSRFTTWAMTIATRIGISELRREYCQDISLDGISADDSLRIEIAVDDGLPADQQLDQRNVLQKLSELIDTQLTDRQRLAVRGLLEGLPVEEVARRMNSNRNAVYKLVHDARMKLREGLEGAGIAADDVKAIFA